MNRDSERYKLFSRRAMIAASGKFLLLSAVAGRMYYLQIIEGERYQTLADENRINLRLLAPPRGRIIDRFGIPMADNQRNYRILIVPEDVKGRDVNTILSLVSRIIPLSKSERRKASREISRKRNFVPITLKENLSWEDMTAIEVNTPDLPGIMIDVGRSRRYLHGSHAAHILGYVAPVPEQYDQKDPLLKLPGFRVGRAGIERIHDLSLRGTGGRSEVEVNAYGRVIRELSRQEGQPGAEITISIDMGLQKAIDNRLEGESASVVVLDISTGDILAMTSSPSFDPNLFNKGLSQREWDKLISNDRSPLINKAISGVYSPGSTFKMVVLLAALEKGVISSHSTVLCRGFAELGDTKFHCWHKDGHGWVAAGDAVCQSCDVYFYEIAKRTGIRRIANMARRFGLGARLGVDLDGEKPGLIPTREWKRRVKGQPWHQGETLIAGIGQGFVLSTPLQLAVMVAQMANGGKQLLPKLTKAVAGSPSSPQEMSADINVNPVDLALIRNSMSRVVNDPSGTAYKSRILIPDFLMGGKTGTVQVRRISAQERELGKKKNKDLPWKERDHALFVGFAPVDKPRYAISVVIEHGGSGSSKAAPVARDILMEAHSRNSSSSAIATAHNMPCSQEVVS
ncbi:MAG: penicillin-binding protein 2 [Magnetovibrio sp.]|nr:penicillin-binding protein 2 [Magnetovibrio sp.]